MSWGFEIVVGGHVAFWKGQCDLGEKSQENNRERSDAHISSNQDRGLMSNSSLLGQFLLVAFLLRGRNSSLETLFPIVQTTLSWECSYLSWRLTANSGKFPHESLISGKRPFSSHQGLQLEPYPWRYWEACIFSSHVHVSWGTYIIHGAESL